MVDPAAALPALAHPRRRELLRLCWDREVPAGELHRALGDVTFGAISQHLAVLRTSGLVTVTAAGRQRLYRADRRALAPFRAWLQASWDDALHRLQLAAELEARRRGPRPGRTTRRRRGTHR